MCPACGSAGQRFYESVPISDLARYWSMLEPGSGDHLNELASRGELPKLVRIAKCRECGLEFGDPMFSVGSDWYERYERYGVRWEYGATLAKLGPDKGSILEIGCGEGYFLEAARSAGHAAVGLDFNAKAIARAKEKGLDARTADLRAVGAESRTFSAIVLYHVIEHVEDPVSLLSEAARVAAPGAKLFVSCPGPRRFTTPMYPRQRPGKRDVWDYPPFHQTRWNEEAMRRVFGRTGWALTSFEEEPLTWIALNAMVCTNDPRFRASGWLGRKWMLASRLPRTLLPSLWYRGMSILAEGVLTGVVERAA